MLDPGCWLKNDREIYAALDASISNNSRTRILEKDFSAKERAAGYQYPASRIQDPVTR
jgi:hypothetical protein